MALYRNISTSFWTDSKVADDFTADERYMFLYILTNPHTNLCGCYEISLKQISFETGLNFASVKKTISTLANKHAVIGYDDSTREILIVNWHRYNWTESGKMRTGIARELSAVKSEQFRAYLNTVFEKRENDAVPYGYPISAVEIPQSEAATGEEDERAEICAAAIKHLNDRCGTNFRATSQLAKKHIYARLEEGYTLEDLLTVVDKMVDKWTGTQMEDYLRPQTLFGTKFDGYLNTKSTNTPKKKVWEQTVEDLLADIADAPTSEGEEVTA